MKEGQAHLVVPPGAHSPWHTSARSWEATCHGLWSLTPIHAESPFLQTSGSPTRATFQPWDIWLNMKMMFLAQVKMSTAPASSEWRPGGCKRTGQLPITKDHVW